MGRFKIRYLVEKKKKNHSLYYWQPKNSLVKLGWHPRRLAEKTNRLEDAILEAGNLNDELDTWRKNGGEVTRAIQPNTMKWLVREYQSSAAYKKLAASTQKEYDRHITTILRPFSNEAIGSISRKVCIAYYNKQAALSLPRANAIMRVFRILMGIAVDMGIIQANPASSMGLVSIPPRQDVWEEEEIKQAIVSCLKIKRSLALSIKIAECLGQRQGDNLAITWQHV